MTPSDREFLIEARRHLVGLVGLIERYAQIDPAPPRWCAGCARCEALNRQQRDAHFTAKKMPPQQVATARDSQN